MQNNSDSKKAKCERKMDTDGSLRSEISDLEK